MILASVMLIIGGQRRRSWRKIYSMKWSFLWWKDRRLSVARMIVTGRSFIKKNKKVSTMEEVSFFRSNLAGIHFFVVPSSEE